jgi:hypothetical protein
VHQFRLVARHDVGAVPVASMSETSSDSGMRASTVGLATLYPFRPKIGSTAPSVTGLRDLLECQLAANSAVGVRQHIAELTALVDRPWRLRRDVAGDPARHYGWAAVPGPARKIMSRSQALTTRFRCA